METVETLLESSLDSVDQAEEQVIAFAKQYGIGEDDLQGLGMAVREGMVNAVVHGNRYSSNKKVHLALHGDPGRVEIHILDEGEGFELAELEDPLAEENLLRQSGRGLLLIKAFVDEFSLRKSPPLGTELRLVKYANP